MRRLWLPSRLSGLALGGGAFAALFLITRTFPLAGGGSGTPPGILFLGAVYGLLNALVAAGIILIYRTSRIINFSQTAIGAIGGVFTYNLVVSRVTGFGYLAAFFAGVIISGLVGVVIELGFVRRFFQSPRLVLTVFTIAIIGALGQASNGVRLLPIFGDLRDREQSDILGETAISLPFDDFRFQIGDLSLPFGFPHLFAVGVAAAALAGLALFLYYSRLGIAVRASAENSERAALLGINVRGLSTLVWGMTGLLSGIGVILTATVSRGWGAVGGINPAAFIAALAAVVVARMKNLPLATATAVGLGAAREAVRWSFEDQLQLFDVFLFGVILVGLLLQRSEVLRSEDAEATSWQAAEEIRPIPKEMLAIGGLRVWRAVGAVVLLLLAFAFPWMVRTSWTNLGGYFAIIGITMLSLVVLTGWAGQVSLGQFALVGIGAILGGTLTSKVGISFWLALPLGAAITSLLSVVIGLPALRIKGLFLAVTTLAFAIAVERNLFEERYFGWLLPERVDRPTLFFFDFNDERSMYYLALLGFLVAMFMVLTLRRSRLGRILIALRDNEANVQSFGVNLVKTRLMAFAVAGALCGFAGVLFVHHQRAVAATSFPAIVSIFIFVDAVIGGISAVSGAVIGAVYFGMFQLFGTNALASIVIGPVGVLVVLYIAPRGLTSVLFGMRDAILRIIAQRRRMVVPSLFADVDPLAVERRLAPLAEPIPGAGLAALPVDLSYGTESRLYAIPRKSSDGHRRAAEEREAFGTVVSRIEESERAER